MSFAVARAPIAPESPLLIHFLTLKLSIILVVFLFSLVPLANRVVVGNLGVYLYANTGRSRPTNANISTYEFCRTLLPPFYAPGGPSHLTFFDVWCRLSQKCVSSRSCFPLNYRLRLSSFSPPLPQWAHSRPTTLRLRRSGIFHCRITMQIPKPPH